MYHSIDPLFKKKITIEIILTPNRTILEFSPVAVMILVLC